MRSVVNELGFLQYHVSDSLERCKSSESLGLPSSFLTKLTLFTLCPFFVNFVGLNVIKQKKVVPI